MKVEWNKPLGKWVASIKVNRKQLHLGVFLDKRGAADAYAKASQFYFGEFAKS